MTKATKLNSWRKFLAIRQCICHFNRSQLQTRLYLLQKQKETCKTQKLPNPCVKTEQFKCERESQKSVYDRQHRARQLNTRSCSTCLETQKTENASQLIFLFIDIIVHGHGVIANHASFLGRIAAVCTRTGCTAVQVWLSTTTTLSGYTQ